LETTEEDLRAAGRAPAAGESADPALADAYWIERYEQEPYYVKGAIYADYAPAYRLGYEARARYCGYEFEELESQLQSGFDRAKGGSRLNWLAARPAARAAWDWAGGTVQSFPSTSSMTTTRSTSPIPPLGP
jgi:hypothetical protein